MSWLENYAQKIDTVPFCKGHCDICKQKNVKVKTLLCNKHFFCRTCREFAPQFRRNDFNCRLCSSATRRWELDKLQAVDTFLDAQTKSTKTSRSEEVAFNLDGTHIVTFDNKDNFSRNTDEDREKTHEESDLRGNNEEWEDLFEQLTKDSSKSVSTHGRNHSQGWTKNHSTTSAQESKDLEEVKQLEPMKRANSYIKLVLPSPNVPAGENNREITLHRNSDRQSQLRQEINTSNRRYRDGDNIIGSEDKAIPMQSCRPKLKNSTAFVPSVPLLPRRRCIQSREQITPVPITTENVVMESQNSPPEEIERGTSPCKFRRGMSKLNWGMCSTMEREDLKKMEEHLIEIEGPIHRSDGGYSSESHDENDEFWDL